MPKYKCKSRDCFLIVKVKVGYKEKIEQKLIDDFLEKNIRGLFKIKRKKKHNIEYIGPVGISLYDRLNKKISKCDFLMILENIVLLLHNLKNSNMNIEDIVLDLNRVYVNEVTRELHFIYLPITCKKNDLRQFVDSIIYSAKPISEDDCECISRFVSFIRTYDTFEIDMLEKYVLSEKNKDVSDIYKCKAIIDRKRESSEKGVDKSTDIFQNDEATGLLQDDEATGLLIDDEATGVLQDDEATSILSENKVLHYISLVRIQNNEKILINKTVFRLGKEEKISDYCIRGNASISRKHADIIYRGSKVYIMDLDSKNGTYINDKMLPAKREVELHAGQKVRLADEEFDIIL